MGLWSSARYDLLLTDAEFWSLTPRQFHALLHRHKSRLERDNYFVGLVASVTANYSMCRPDPPFSASDFMLNRKIKEATDYDIAEDFAAKFALIAVRPGVPIP